MPLSAEAAKASKYTLVDPITISDPSAKAFKVTSLPTSFV